MANTPTEKWFIAVLVFESSIVADPTDDDTRVDIQYRLIRAVDAEGAYQRAVALGKREEVSYENVSHDTCKWTFAGLADLRVVDAQKLTHGAEIYGFIERGAASEHVVAKADLTKFSGG